MPQQPQNGGGSSSGQRGAVSLCPPGPALISATANHALQCRTPLRPLPGCQNLRELQLSVQLRRGRKAIWFSRSRCFAQRSRSARGAGPAGMVVLPGAARAQVPKLAAASPHQEPPIAPLPLPQHPSSSLPGSADVSVSHIRRHRSRCRWRWADLGPRGAARSFLPPPRFLRRDPPAPTGPCFAVQTSRRDAAPASTASRTRRAPAAVGVPPPTVSMLSQRGN